MTIINFMPAHKQAPVALWLLKKDVAAAAEKIICNLRRSQMEIPQPLL